MLLDHALDGGTSEGCLACKHLVEDATQAVQVAAPIQVLRASSLLGRHIGRRPDGRPSFGQAISASSSDGAGNAEICNNSVTSLKENVLWFNVAVDDIACVREAQGISDFLRDLKRIFDWELSFVIQALPE